MIAAFRKHLSAPGLLKTLWSCFQKGADKPPPGKVEIALVDALMAGLAVFGLKYPSLLKFDEERPEASVRPVVRGGDRSSGAAGGYSLSARADHPPRRGEQERL